jgi:hypothetical protein
MQLWLSCKVFNTQTFNSTEYGNYECTDLLAKESKISSSW